MPLGFYYPFKVEEGPGLLFAITFPVYKMAFVTEKTLNNYLLNRQIVNQW